MGARVAPYAVAAVLLAAAAPAHAVVLEQQWKPGQQLTYDLSFNGTVNLQVPTDIPNMLAGIPIEAAVKLNGQTTLDTLSVEENGSGMVAVRLDSLQSRADAFGQTVQLNYKDGRGKVLMNGQATNNGNDMDWSMLQKPNVAWRISKLGRFEAMVPITKPATDAATAGTQTEEAPPAAGSTMPFNVPAFIQSLVARALPPLWPGREVQTGDKWSAEIGWPLPARAGAAPATPPARSNLGKADMVLRGEEMVLGRKVQRIGIDGNFELTEQQSASLTDLAPAPAADAKPDKPRAADRLNSASQRVKGDLWFDAAAGQIVRVDVDLQGSGKSRQKGGRVEDGGLLDFNGKLKMDLRKLSYSSESVATANAAAAVAAGNGAAQ
jgi:hypothetical protein